VLHFERVLHLSGSGRLKDKKNETLTPAVAEPAGFILTRFNMGTSLIGTSLNICVLIATSTYVTSNLLLYKCPHTYYYICVLSFTVFFTLFSIGSSLNIRDRACASLTLVGIARDTDVGVGLCLCKCSRVCTCSNFLCVSLSGVCVCVIYLFFRGTKYISVLVLLYF
jgi:hypothetical protein